MTSVEQRGTEPTADVGREASVASITHELLNDLAALFTFSNLIADELGSPGSPNLDDIREDVAEVCAAAQRARALGSQLSDLVTGGGDG